MITKERLEELIKQCATIYKIRDKTICEYHLSLYNYIENNELMYQNITIYYGTSWVGKLEDLFETEEDVRWELEMTATRTETLKMPKWEEFKKNKRFIFIGANHTWYAISISRKKIFLNIHYEDWTDYEDWKPIEATKENYIEACKLCLRLFRGEKV